MPYKDPIKARDHARLRQRKWLNDPSNRETSRERVRNNKTRPEAKAKDEIWRVKYRDENKETLRSKQRENQPRRNEQQKERYHANPEKRRRAIDASLASRLKKKYGLTQEQKDELFIRHGSKCPICKSAEPQTTKRFCVDHCHKTTKIRGILCHHCNVLLGYAKDNIEILAAAIEYLKGHNAAQD